MENFIRKHIFLISKRLTVSTQMLQKKIKDLVQGIRTNIAIICTNCNQGEEKLVTITDS